MAAGGDGRFRRFQFRAAAGSRARRFGLGDHSRSRRPRRLGILAAVQLRGAGGHGRRSSAGRKGVAGAAGLGHGDAHRLSRGSAALGCVHALSRSCRRRAGQAAHRRAHCHDGAVGGQRLRLVLSAELGAGRIHPGRLHSGAFAGRGRRMAELGRGDSRRATRRAFHIGVRGLGEEDLLRDPDRHRPC